MKVIAKIDDNINVVYAALEVAQLDGHFYEGHEGITWCEDPAEWSVARFGDEVRNEFGWETTSGNRIIICKKAYSSWQMIYHGRRHGLFGGNGIQPIMHALGGRRFCRRAPLTVLESSSEAPWWIQGVTAGACHHTERVVRVYNDIDKIQNLWEGRYVELPHGGYMLLEKYPCIRGYRRGRVDCDVEFWTNEEELQLPIVQETLELLKWRRDDIHITVPPVVIEEDE